MFSSRIKQLIVLAIAGLQLQACGEDWNVNKIFVSEAQKESLVSLLEDAQIAYDDGRFSDALRFTKKAEKISPFNEQIAILFGYINLALSGMDTFKIAGGLITANTSSKKDTESSAEANLLASSSSATIFFDKLKDVVKLDEETLAKFGEVSSADDLQAFSDYDVILPMSAVKARALDDVKVMQYINEAIKKICPFVDEDLRINDKDARHNSDNCPTTTTARERKTVSHFLWAFVHIAEAVVFYSVVQYQEEERTKPNITLRTEALTSAADDLTASSYARHAVSLADSMTKIYAVDDPESQFSALVNNIGVASATFAANGKMPTKIKQSLTRAVASIDKKKNEVGGSSETEQKNNSFKNQINEKIAADMSKQINDYAQNSPDEFAGSKDDLCSSYDTVSGGTTKPLACQE